MDKQLNTFCKVMLKQIKATWGDSWTRLGDDLMRAIIAQQVLHVFTGLDEGTKIAPSKIAEYNNALKNYCGLDTDVNQGV